MKFPKAIQLHPRERLLSIGSAIVLIAVVLDRLVLSPWLHHAQTIRQEIEDMEQALQTHTRLLNRKESVLASHRRYQRYLRPHIADDLHMAILLKEVEDMAQESQVSLEEIKPSAVETTALEKRYALDVKFTCTLEQWVAFLYRVESSTSLYQVIRASLERDTEHPGMLKGSLRLVNASSTADEMVVAPAASGTLPAAPGVPSPADDQPTKAGYTAERRLSRPSGGPGAYRTGHVTPRGGVPPERRPSTPSGAEELIEVRLEMGE